MHYKLPCPTSRFFQNRSNPDETIATNNPTKDRKKQTTAKPNLIKPAHTLTLCTASDLVVVVSLGLLY
jgi:hypothetical protein